MMLTLRRSARAGVYFTSPATSAKSVWSLPTPTSAMTRMAPSVTVSPTLPARLSTLRWAPSSTRYCLPPLRTMAYIGNSDHPDRKSRRARARRWTSIPDGRVAPTVRQQTERLGPRARGDGRWRAHQAHEVGGDPEQCGQTHDRGDERDRVREWLC